MWFSTKYGLNKYDGMEFTHYTHDPDNPDSISDNFVWNVLEDGSGALWIITYGGGLNKFDPATERFTRYRHDPNNPRSLNNDFGWCMYEDSKGNFWVGHEKGLDRFDPETGHFFHYVHDPDDPSSLSHNTVTLMAEDKQGFLWIGTFGGGLNRFDPQAGTFSHYRHGPENETGLSNDTIFSVFIDRKNTLWIGTLEGLNKLEIPSESDQVREYAFVRYLHDPRNSKSLSHNKVKALYEDKQGTLWVGTTGGLNRYNREDGTFTRYLADAKPGSLSSNSIYHINSDVSGALWVGTANGVNKADPGSRQFDLYMHGSQVRAIYENEDGTFLAGTSASGLNIVDRTRDIALPLGHQSENSMELSGNIVTKIISAQDDELWIATLDGGLNKCRLETGNCLHYRHDANDPHSLQSGSILDLAIAPNGVLWIATLEHGLYKYDSGDGRFVNYRYDERNPGTIASNWTRTVYVDSGGVVWLGTEKGLSRLYPDTGAITNYPAKKNRSAGLSDAIVNMVCEDREGHIWIATNGGLNRLNPSTDEIIVYREKHGLPGNSISAVLEDDRGNIWVSTNNGISKFDPQNNTFRNYDTLDGLQGRQFIYHSAFKSRSGEIFFGGVNGLNAFFPDRLTENSFVPPVCLTDFRIFNQPVPIGHDSPLQRHIGFVNRLTLSHEQSVFSFEFAALNYRASEKNRYAYIMEGFEKNWTYVDCRHREAKYTNLDPGSYIFRVRASNNDGIWNEEGVSLNLTILPSWWQSWWARGLLILSFIGVGIGIYYGRIKTIENQKHRLEAQVINRTQALLESETRYRELFNTMNSGVAVYEPVEDGNDFVFLEFNRAGERIENVGREDIIGKRVTEVFPAAKDFGILSILRRVWLNGGLEYYPPALYKNERGESWRESYVYKLPSGEIVSVYDDVTERMDAEKKLRREKSRAEEANQAKGMFLANMSHELRTPMNAILGFSQIMGNDPNLKTEHRKHLEVIHRNGQHLMNLINDVLDMSKIEAGKITLNENDFDLCQMLDHLGEMFRLKAENKSLFLIVERRPGIPKHIRTDETKLRQVLVNLIGNAVKFTKMGGVTIRVKSKEREVDDFAQTLCFEIEDTGSGIALEETASLFEPFAQTDTGRQSHEGTGLGLPISRKFVQLMGGDITVQSEPGKGSVFTFHIGIHELACEDAKNNFGTCRPVGLEPGQIRFKILIVDDTKDSRKLIVQLLQPFGFELREAVNGKEAVDFWQDWRPDLVWMDIRMPVMNGYEAVKKIRSLETAVTEKKPTVIIAQSASSFEEERKVVLEAGCDDFLRKPFRERDFFERMHKHLDIRFVYEDEKADGGHPRRVSKAEITPASFSGVADELLETLKQAALQADVATVERLVKEMRATHPELADWLGAVAYDFEYWKILQMIEGTDEPGDTESGLA